MDPLAALELERAARTAAGSGTDVIPNCGAPVLVMPRHVQEAVARAASAVHQRHTRGEPVLLHALADDLATRLSISVDPETELLISHGAMHGLAVTFKAHLNSGDEVLIPAPTYFFHELVIAAGATPTYVPCLKDDHWRWDLDALRSAISHNTRAIVVCNPNNPTGYLPARAELEGLLDLARRHDLTIVSDESYSRYAFDGRSYIPLSTLAENGDRLVTVTSLSKNYAFSNWRIGYVHTRRELLEPILKWLEWEVINVGPIPQAAAAAAVAGPQQWIEQVLGRYQHKRDLLHTAVGAAGFTAVLPAAGAFMLADLSALGAGRELEQRLLKLGVVALAGDCFHGPGDHARLLFGGEAQDLKTIGERLMSVSERHRAA